MQGASEIATSMDALVHLKATHTNSSSANDDRTDASVRTQNISNDKYLARWQFSRHQVQMIR